jgi:hypothetical protein
MGGVTIPRIIFVEPDGNRIFIDCANIPKLGGSEEELTITNVKRNPPGTNEAPYEFLSIPLSPNTEPATPEDIEIHLNNAITPGHPGSMDLPYNGGPANTVSVKIGH